MGLRRRSGRLAGRASSAPVRSRNALTGCLADGLHLRVVSARRAARTRGPPDSRACSLLQRTRSAVSSHPPIPRYSGFAHAPYGKTSRRSSARCPTFLSRASSSTTSPRCSRTRPGFRGVIDGLRTTTSDTQVDVVLGIEARGFIFAPALAYALGAGFVPVRKPKKLPAECVRGHLRSGIWHRHPGDAQGRGRHRATAC